MIVYFKCVDIKDKGCGLVPWSRNAASAVMGFHKMGIECCQYTDLREIEDKFTREDVLIDGIAQVNYILGKMGIVPEEYDYPTVLQGYMGRKFFESTINTVNSSPELWGNFVKPVKDKLFTGRVINSPKDLIGCGTYGEDNAVLVVEPVNFVYESRGFVYYDKMIDMRGYAGDWHIMRQLNTDVIDRAMQDFVQWDKRPNACAIDWGVTREGKTLLVEVNSFSATAGYGLDDIMYAKMISAYFAQCLGVVDICKF